MNLPICYLFYMETILEFAPELAADPVALAEFEKSYCDFLDSLDAQE